MRQPIIFSNKRADMSARKSIFYTIFGFVAVIAFILLVWMVPSYKSELSTIPLNLENHLLIQRFLNSPLCFTPQDKDTNRFYPGVIDLTKFNQENLDECYNAEDTKVKAYRLTLDYNNQKITINTKNWEGVLKKAQTEHVFVYDEREIQRAELLIEMQNAK